MSGASRSQNPNIVANSSMTEMRISALVQKWPPLLHLVKCVLSFSVIVARTNSLYVSISGIDLRLRLLNRK